MRNLVPHDINEWMRAMESRMADLTRRLEPIRSAFFQSPGGFDTGWQEITNWDSDFDPQTGGNTPMVRRYGPIVSVKGRATTTVDEPSGATVYTLPSGFGFEPSGSIHEAGRSLIPGATNGAQRYYVTTSGVGSQNGLGALGVSAGSLVTISTTWMVELP